MANQKEIEAMYDWVDYFHELRLGKNADFTCAFFDGDFSKTLDQAQKDKHEYILDGLNFNKGDRILDIGCGWGPVLRVIKDKGGQGVGLTLSSAQQRYCAKDGLKAVLQDYKTASTKDLGEFDGIVSVGALEHFCSIEEFKKGQQEKIYQDFFKFCYDLLPKGGRLYLQTMVWGKKVPNPDEISFKAPKNSDELILARTVKFYPGSWLPKGKDQIVDMAKPYFKLVSSNNGRLDYIETVDRWDKAIKLFFTTWRFFPGLFAGIKLLPRYIANPDFRAQVEFVKHRDQYEIFKREIFSHERMIFEKL